MEQKKVLFLTGTRADYGKMKPLMQALNNNPKFNVFVFVCGMHLSETFGSTYEEVLKDGYQNTYIAYGLSQTQNTSINLGNTIACLSGYVENIRPDMLIVHGDRMEALAGAVVGALHNILVAHIEGGELSGTIDESIRHAVSKFAHVHFVCTEEARMRLIQLGEEPNRIYVVGSPDIDIMMGGSLPPLEKAKSRYDISFADYGILMYHPVTTEYRQVGSHCREVVDGAIESEKNYIVIFPNNDLGSEVILNEYKRFEGNERFRIFPSLRFEYFLSFLKHAEFIIGNSSVGIRESGIYGIPAIDIGSRQSGRYDAASSPNIQHINEDKEGILRAIRQAGKYRTPSFLFGDGNSTEKVMEIVAQPRFWEIKIQKHFIDHMM